jgi:hypothetical protein
VTLSPEKDQKVPTEDPSRQAERTSKSTKGATDLEEEVLTVKDHLPQVVAWLSDSTSKIVFGSVL